MKKVKLSLLLTCLFLFAHTSLFSQAKSDTLRYQPFEWKSEVPPDSPFKQSKELTGIKLLGIKSGFHYGDTWYPTHGLLMAIFILPGPMELLTALIHGQADFFNNGEANGDGNVVRKATTGQAVIRGDDPMKLEIEVLGLSQADPYPYGGRYPCGSLIYNGIWYYGTYCLSPYGITQYGDKSYNWPQLGPFVGFRYSTDYGKTWIETPHKPSDPIFKETGLGGYPVKIGTPHFIDFGKNMQYSPDGKAYLVAHGSDQNSAQSSFYHNSWITGDQVYLLRVTPSIENMNDRSKYEFYAGKDKQGEPVWTKDFQKIKPLLEWRENMGCVTVTYNAPLKKYLMCLTDGGNTCAKMSTYILESDKLTGEWKMVTYLKDFGEQAYFVNIPSKFISKDGKTAWMLYSGNYATNWNGEKIAENPPGSHYGLVLQKFEFIP